MAREALRATEAVRRLGRPTNELLRLVHNHKIGFGMVKGIAHISVDAFDEYGARAS